MKNDNENLKELLDGLFDKAEAVRAMSDIQAGDALIAGADDPKVNEAVVMDIKMQVRNRLHMNKHRRFVWHTSEAAVAAVLVIGVLLSFVLTNISRNSGEELNLNIWANSTPEQMVIDPEYSLLVGEVEDIQSSLLTIRLDEDFVENYDLLEIEMEMLEIESSLWKG